MLAKSSQRSFLTAIMAFEQHERMRADRRFRAPQSLQPLIDQTSFRRISRTGLMGSLCQMPFLTCQDAASPTARELNWPLLPTMPPRSLFQTGGFICSSRLLVSEVVCECLSAIERAVGACSVCQRDRVRAHGRRRSDSADQRPRGVEAAAFRPRRRVSRRN
eukprot:6205809-Pleurochrysis_carterae.AAC.1